MKISTRSKDQNENIYYYEEQILKIWDSYIQSNKLKYLKEGNVYRNSLYINNQSIFPSFQAGILVDDKNIIYTNNINHKLQSISICGAVDYLTSKNHNGITNDLEVALAQIVENIENILENHIILFPYHMTAANWVLSTLKLEFNNSKKLIKANLYTYIL